MSLGTNETERPSHPPPSSDAFVMPHWFHVPYDPAREPPYALQFPHTMFETSDNWSAAQGLDVNPDTLTAPFTSGASNDHKLPANYASEILAWFTPADIIEGQPDVLVGPRHAAEFDTTGSTQPTNFDHVAQPYEYLTHQPEESPPTLLPIESRGSKQNNLNPCIINTSAAHFDSHRQYKSSSR